MTRIAVGLRAQHRISSQFQTLEEINPLQTTLFRTGYCKHESRLALRSAEIRPLFRRFVKCIERKTLDSFYTSLPPPQPKQPPSNRHKAGLARVDHNLPVQSPSQVSGSNRYELRSALYPLHCIQWAAALLVFGRAALPSPCLHTAQDSSCRPLIKHY